MKLHNFRNTILRVKCLIMFASTGLLAVSTPASLAAKVSNSPGKPDYVKTSGVIPFDSTGCSQSVCLHLIGPSGYSYLSGADVYNGGYDCLPTYSEVYLWAGPSVSNATLYKQATVEPPPPGECTNGFTFNLQQNYESGWWFCGTLSALPGRACNYVKGPAYF